ncbi:MAG: biotin--[acetyl-CoA-carboxylase] ligase [Thermoplasmatota archaeon]
MGSHIELDEGSVSCLNTNLIGNQVVYLRSCGSTNDEVKKRARDGAGEGLVVVSTKQDSGRGRLDRSFISPEGGLYVSVLLRPRKALDQLSALPLIAGLVVSKAISTSTLITTTLKWPNDVLVDGAKVSGTVVEAEIKGDSVEFVVVGMGINCNFHLEDLPSELHHNSSTLMDIKGEPIDLSVLFRDLICFMDMKWASFLEGGAQNILEEWSARSSTIGRRVRVESFGSSIQGQALGVDQSGALIIDDGKGMSRVTIGDCRHLDSADESQD